MVMARRRSWRTRRFGCAKFTNSYIGRKTVIFCAEGAEDLRVSASTRRATQSIRRCP